MPPLFVEGYVPITGANGTPRGVAEVYIDQTGTAVESLRLAKLGKNNPSRAIAYGTLAPLNTDELRDPIAEITMANVIQ